MFATQYDKLGLSLGEDARTSAGYPLFTASQYSYRFALRCANLFDSLKFEKC